MCVYIYADRCSQKKKPFDGSVFSVLRRVYKGIYLYMGTHNGIYTYMYICIYIYIYIGAYKGKDHPMAASRGSARLCCLYWRCWCVILGHEPHGPGGIYKYMYVDR